MTPTRLAGLGAFVISGILLFAIGLFLIGERRMLFADKVIVQAEFRKVSGLQQGAPVKVSGMRAGEVRAIAVPRGPGGRFVVTFDVRDDLHPLLRADSVASIETEGLVGGTYLAVTMGSEQGARLEPGATIPSREPFEVADLLQQMSETVRMVNETITVLRGDVETAVRAVADTAEHADALIQDVSEDVRRISDAGRRIADDTSTILADVRGGRGTLGRLVNDDELYRRATAIARETQVVVENARAAVEDARQTVAKLRSANGGAGQGVVEDLRQTLGHARTALANLEESTEALKHNWFFRGYFRRRGFFDLAQVSAAEYAAGALEQEGRRRLRIWIGADRLFEPAEQGTGERLTEQGRQAIDSAMQVYLGYPGDTPVVVEGYAEADGETATYLRARARAQLVRDYLIRRFGRQPQLTGAIPMGEADEDAPGDGPFRGVALAAFVPEEE